MIIIILRYYVPDLQSARCNNIIYTFRIIRVYVYLYFPVPRLTRFMSTKSYAILNARNISREETYARERERKKKRVAMGDNCAAV